MCSNREFTQRLSREYSYEGSATIYLVENKLISFKAGDRSCEMVLKLNLVRTVGDFVEQMTTVLE